MNTSDDKLTATIKATSINIIEDATVDGVDIIQLYNPINCLRCSSLISLSTKEELEWEKTTGQELLYNMNCHHSLGNSKCPASALRIAKHVDIDHVVDLYHEALNTGDIKRLASIVKRIQAKDSNTSQLIMDRIRNLSKTPTMDIPLVTEIDKTPVEPETEQPVEQTNDVEVEPQPTTPILDETTPNVDNDDFTPE